jgi:hypothetical protein
VLFEVRRTNPIAPAYILSLSHDSRLNLEYGAAVPIVRGRMLIAFAGNNYGTFLTSLLG